MRLTNRSAGYSETQNKTSTSITESSNSTNSTTTSKGDNDDNETSKNDNEPSYLDVFEELFGDVAGANSDNVNVEISEEDYGEDPIPEPDISNLNATTIYTNSTSTSKGGIKHSKDRSDTSSVKGHQRIHTPCLTCHVQNTTSLLFFSKPNGAHHYDALISKYTSPNKIKQLKFKPEGQTVVIIHGWQGTVFKLQPWAVELKDAILAHPISKGTNVLFADWNHHARELNYLKSVNKMPEVARDIVQVLGKFESVFPNFKKENVHVMGHSLGSHIAGLIGQLMDRNLKQITGLDVAGPEMFRRGANLKMTKDDAKYVIAHHTEKNIFGTDANTADFDVYFNGLRRQPICWALPMVEKLCAHFASGRYSIPYMGKCQMIAYSCASYVNYEVGECGFCGKQSEGCVIVGNQWQYEGLEDTIPKGYNIRKNETDVAWTEPGSGDTRYYLKTSGLKPYCEFTYQLVVKFVEPAKQRSFDVELQYKGAKGRRNKIRVTNLVDPENGLEVFSGGRGNNTGETEIVSGELVFSALVSFDPMHEFYHKMPIKFDMAIISKEMRPTTSDEKNGTESTKVYVNFMSHVAYDYRAKFSGPVSVQFKTLSSTRVSGEGGATLVKKGPEDKDKEKKKEDNDDDNDDDDDGDDDD